jgi:hypothetical protein
VSTVIRKGLIGKNDVNFYTAASPTFSRSTSSGGATTLTAVAATHLPLIQSAASRYWTQNTVQRAVNEGISRYFSKQHSIATYGGGAAVGEHNKVFGFKNAVAATSIQAAASNQYKIDGFARVVIPEGTYTCATPIQLPRKCWIYGNGRGTVVRASSTIQTSRVFTISGSLGATTSNLAANATIGTQVVGVADGSKFTKDQWVLVSDSLNSEIQQIKSISSNDVTMNGVLLHTYRTAATVKNITLLYPAELVMDHLDIQLTSATQGYGVAATYLVRSYVGEEVRVSGAANAGVLVTTGAGNKIVPQIFKPSSVAAGKGYGVRLKTSSHNNQIGGVRDGTAKDVADGKSVANWVFGTTWRGPAVASGLPDPIAFYYRNNKPQLS